MSWAFISNFAFSQNYYCRKKLIKKFIFQKYDNIERDFIKIIAFSNTCFPRFKYFQLLSKLFLEGRI